MPTTLDSSGSRCQQLVVQLDRSLQEYSAARERSIRDLYQKKQSKQVDFNAKADWEEVAASCGYFSFALLDFARELKHYLSLAGDLEDEKEGRTWSWLRPWKRKFANTGKSDTAIEVY